MRKGEVGMLRLLWTQSTVWLRMSESLKTQESFFLPAIDHTEFLWVAHESQESIRVRVSSGEFKGT